jgi:hypothetical protein
LGGGGGDVYAPGVGGEGEAAEGADGVDDVEDFGVDCADGFADGGDVVGDAG